MSNKIAIVTGANKGIGYAIVRELCKRNVGVVYLTARDVKRGQAAVDDLKKEGLNPIFHQLEVTEKDSIKALADHIKKKHGGFDILINNAAVIVKDYYKTTYEDAKQLLDINYYSVLDIQKFLFPLLNENGRVINISSDCGHLSNITNKEWLDRLSKKDLQLEDVNAFVEWFLNNAKNGTIKDEDFVETPMLAYRISKVALSALSKVQQKQVGKNISVNSLHPGFVQTDMTKSLGALTMDESAKAPAYLALDAPQSLKGEYVWFDKKVVDWYDLKTGWHCHFENFEKVLKEGGHI